MKIRNGFVSNSSSSSFHIYGTVLYESELRKIILEKSLATEKEIEEYSIGEFFGDLEDLCDEETTDIELMFFFDSEDEMAYFGREYSSMQDEETLKEFKKTATEKVVSFLGKNFFEQKECEEIEETI